MPLEKVTFGDGLPGYETGEKSRPSLIVIQEWWGINDLIKDLSFKLAGDSGYRVLVPDLYKGKIGVDAEEAAHLMNHLDFKGAVEELKQAAAYLRSTGSPKVAITGFCMGGALTFAAMSEGIEVDAGAPFYGVPDARYFQLEKITKPVLATFGALDAHKGFADPEAAQAAADKIKAAGTSVDLKIYPTAGHGFMNALVPGGKELMEKLKNAVPSDEDLKDAYDRLLAFLKAHLG